MLPIFDGRTRSSFAVTSGNGKKRYAMSYSFHLDTGEVAQKAGIQLQRAAEKGYEEVSKYVRRKYQTMKVKRAVGNMKKSLYRSIKLDLPVSMKSLKSRFQEAVHA